MKKQNPKERFIVVSVLAPKCDDMLSRTTIATVMRSSNDPLAPLVKRSDVQGLMSTIVWMKARGVTGMPKTRLLGLGYTEIVFKGVMPVGQ